MNYVKTLWELAGLIKNTGMSRREMQQLQEKKLRSLLSYAWDHSDFYRETFRRAGVGRDQLETVPLSALPTIDKSILMKNFDRLVTAEDLKQEQLRRFDEREQVDRRPYLGKYHVVHSSGSTGTPGYFVYDEAAWNQMLLGIIRGALWDMGLPRIVKLLASRPRILYIAATDGRYGGAMAVGDGIDGVGAKQLYLDIKTPLSDWAETVRAFAPNIIIGYPSAIKILAGLVRDGAVPVHIVRIISCGEPLGGGLRVFLEKTFACPVINIYGASESLALGVETGREDGLLLFDDLNIIEVQDGAMYLTCLYNYAQPLIRYRITDRLVKKAPLPGSPFTRAEILLGRSEDVLWFEDGAGGRDFLHPLAVEGLCIPGLRDYQFRQLSSGAFEMLAEVFKAEDEERIRSEILSRMKKILEEKRLDYVRFSVRFVERISPSLTTGKKPLIVTAKETEMEAAG